MTGKAMNSAYDILTKCQNRLLLCEMNEIDRLHLEMCIIRTKIVMLAGKRSASHRDPVDEVTEIEAVYGLICDHCASGGDAGTVDAIVERLAIVRERLRRLA